MLQLHKIIRVSHVVSCPIVFILFHDRDWQGSVQIYEKLSFFSIFNRLGFFPKFLGR